MWGSVGGAGRYPSRKRGRSLGLPAALAISVLLHFGLGTVVLVWPRSPDLTPQITLDLVDESEAVAQEEPGAPAPDQKPAKSTPQAKEPEKIAPPTPEKIARVVPQVQRQPERPVEVRVLEPQKPEPKKPEPKKPEPKKPEPEKLEPPKPTPLPPELRRMKMVDQDNDRDEPENKEALLLAQKNRRVKEETRARDTNLERQSRGQTQGSAPSERRDEQVGGPKEKIAETAEERSHLERKAPRVTPHADERVPEQRDRRPRNLLSMRDLPRRTHEVPSGARPEEVPQAPDGVLRGREAPAPEGSLSRRDQRAQSPGTGRELKLSLTGDDFDKVVGRDEQERNRRMAQREMSHHAGRWEKKWGAIKSSLENFIPEVRPGNQTALNTRAAPFAAYIARMHRNIHRLWGFGVLEDWDMKSSSNPLNDMTRWTMLEIVLNRDGTIDKVTVVRPSGYLPYDVAAMDVVMAAGPYPDPPREILSANGKIYLHWRFHRDHRQCGTFGVDPYILTTPPKGPSDRPVLPVDAEEVGRGPQRGLPSPEPARTPRRLARSAARPVVVSPHTYRGPAPAPAAPRPQPEEPDPAAARRAARALVSPDDPGALSSARGWLAAYVRGDARALVAQSRLPFRSGDKVVAEQAGELLRLYRSLLDEAPKKRSSTRLEIFTAAGLRAKLGTLPRGGADGEGMLFALAGAGSESFVLMLQSARGQWRVVGLAR